MEQRLNSLRDVLAVLLRQYEYSLEIGTPAESVAVSFRTLEEREADEMDVRWFLAKGYVREFERRSDSRNGAAAAVCSSCRVKRSEFVLTDTGAEFARLVLSGSGDQPANRRAKPVWTRGSRRLCFQGKLVKAFKQPAGNQAKILAAFQEEGWPHHIYDPLPPRADLDAPERLRATVKRLNRHQQHELLRFECDGRGEGIVWRPRD